ncbi:VWA domain-containing protein [Leucobacter zeae]|nr:VWA domain-containing protein [Leucobacter zeae]
MSASASSAARLEAVAALLGIPIEVTDGAEWEVTDGRLRVGLGWYAVRGHGPAEAEALALLQLWETVRADRAAPDRERRRRSIATLRPELDPLLEAVARVQASAELIEAMPGMRTALVAAIRRSIPDDLSSWQRHLQWVGALMRAGIAAAAGAGPWTDPGVSASEAAVFGLDPAVLDEWAGLGRMDAQRIPDPTHEPLRRVLIPDPSRTPLRRFERALALLLPPYERLLRLDAETRGWSGGDGARDGVDGGDGASDGGEFGESAPGASGADPDAGDAEGAGESATAESERDAARKGEGRQTAEGADLFAAEQAGFVSTILATPMPSDGAVFAALLDALPDALAAADRDRDGAPAAQGAHAAPGDGGATAITEYRARADDLADAIERMRDVWSRVIAERVGTRAALSRDARPEGESLATERLAGAVAEARAGVRRPAAFRERVHRRRRTRRAGSTDYVLLVDRSASMSGPAAEAAADAMLIMIEALAGVERDILHAERAGGVDLELDIRTALIVFDAEAHVVKPLSHGLDDAARRAVHSAIRSPRGSTNDAAALRAAGAQLGVGASASEARTAPDGLQRRRIAILVGDGGTSDPLAAAVELRRLRDAGVAVHGIGIGDDDIVARYAPSGRRLDDPRGLAETLRELVADELP